MSSNSRMLARFGSFGLLCVVPTLAAAQAKQTDVPIPSLMTAAPNIKAAPALDLEPNKADLQPKLPKYNIRSPNGNECDWEMKMARDLGRGLPTAESRSCRNNAWRKRNRIDDK
jgi:hypothetical protein